MNNIKLNRKILIFSDNIKRFFALNKSLVIITIFFLLFGFITGIFCSLKTDVDFSSTDITNILLKSLINKNLSLIMFFILKSLFFVLLIFSLFFCSFLKISRILIFIIIFFSGYFLGIDSTILFICFGGIKGSVFVIITYLPLEFLIYFVLYCYMLKLADFNKQISIYGNCSIKNQENCILWILILSSILMVLIQVILMFLFFNIFIFI